MNAQRFNAYKVLGVHRGSSDEEIKAAFREACGRLHPDRENGNAEGFMEVTAAYHDVKNENKRAALADLMAFTANKCGTCDGKGFKKKLVKRKPVMSACDDCGGCGYVPKVR